MLTNVLLFSLIVCGLTQIIAVSKLFEPIRDLFPHAEGGERVKLKTFVGSVLRCPMCLGVWIGAGIALVSTPLWLTTSQNDLLRTVSPYSVGAVIGIFVAAGAIGSAVAWGWHVLLAWLGALKL